MKSRAVALLSGGLDSTVNIYEAQSRGYEVVMALTANYGQRAATHEIRSSEKIANRLGVPHMVVPLPFFSEFGGSALIDRKQVVPMGQDVQIESAAVSNNTAKAVWVPNRNGILLNLAAGFAESLQAGFVIPGFNAEEAKTFPDNREEFLEALTKSFSYSTQNAVQAICFTTGLEKPQIAKRAKELGVVLSDLWFCYLDGSSWCGQCESCQRNRRALHFAGFTLDGLFAE